MPVTVVVRSLSPGRARRSLTTTRSRQAGLIRLKVVVLKDEKNKKSYSQSAQMACEAASAIRTVASLTREDDCSRIYSTVS